MYIQLHLKPLKGLFQLVSLLNQCLTIASTIWFGSVISELYMYLCVTLLLALGCQQRVMCHAAAQPLESGSDILSFAAEKMMYKKTTLRRKGGQVLS